MLSHLLNQLIKYYEEDPTDAFNIYALATEYLKSDLTKSLALFEHLVVSQPDYTATYYHLAKLYEQLSNRSKAIEVYEKGIDACTRLKAAHALKELKNAYQELIFE